MYKDYILKLFLLVFILTFMVQITIGSSDNVYPKIETKQDLDSHVVSGQIIVKTKNRYDTQDLLEEEYNIKDIKVKRNFRKNKKQIRLMSEQSYKSQNISDTLIIETNEDINEIISVLESNEDVIYAEPNYLAQEFYTPNDPALVVQWAHDITDAEDAWDIERGDSSVIIAIIDTGIDYTHEDLEDNMLDDCNGGCAANTGYDFVEIDTQSYIDAGYTLIAQEDYTNPDNNPMDYRGHGTAVAGVAIAATNNGLGVAGVCHDCSLMPIRAGFAIINPSSVSTATMEYDDIADAIYYAVDNGADVISLSFGGPNSVTLQDAVDYAYDNGVLVIAASGNSGDDSSKYPAAYSNVIGVAATDSSDERASFSNYGEDVNVAAPGENILTTTMTTGPLSTGSGYGYFDGTSFAAPYVAGIAALLKSDDSSLTPTQLRWIIENSVDSITPDEYIGTGRVNILNALTYGAVPNVCSSCAECQDMINASSSGDIITFGSDITFTTGSCMDLENYNNITIDCDGYSLTGSRGALGTAINLDGNSNISIINCEIDNFYEGIYMFSSENVNIENITLEACTNGLSILNTKNVNIDNATIRENTAADFYFNPYSDTDNCNVTFSDVIGSGNNPIGFYSSTVTLNSQTFSHLVLCNASFSTLSDVNVEGSATYQNNGFAMYLTHQSTIDGLTSVDNFFGIRVGNSHMNYFNNINTSDNWHYGIEIQSSENNVLNNTDSSRNTQAGFHMRDSDNNEIVNLTSSGSVWSSGISIYDSGSVVVKGSRFENNADNGMTLSNAGMDGGLQVYNNYFNNVENVEFLTSQSNVTFNTSIDCSASNINGGVCIGGNYWASFGAGYSEVCRDLDSDGFCDTEYNFSDAGTSSVAIDYLPLSLNVAPSAGDNCNSCLSCTQKLALAGAGDTISLIQDITDHSGNCILLTQGDVNFDCQGNTIDGIGNGYGIYASGYEYSGLDNIDILNCDINEFDRGINIKGFGSNKFVNYFIQNISLQNNNDGLIIDEVNNSRIENVAISSFDGGIYVYRSNSNVFVDIDSSNNGYSGLYVYDSAFNNITNSTFNSNGHNGLRFHENADNNYAFKNTIENNAYYGVGITDSNNNNISSNVFTNNNNSIGIFNDAISNKVYNSVLRGVDFDTYINTNNNTQSVSVEYYNVSLNNSRILFNCFNANNCDATKYWMLELNAKHYDGSNLANHPISIYDSSNTLVGTYNTNGSGIYKMFLPEMYKTQSALTTYGPYLVNTTYNGNYTQNTTSLLNNSALSLYLPNPLVQNPRVQIISPLNDSLISDDLMTTFSFRSYDFDNTQNCSLFVNGTEEFSILTTNGVTVSTQILLDDETDYNFYVNCDDGTTDLDSDVYVIDTNLNPVITFNTAGYDMSTTTNFSSYTKYELKNLAVTLENDYAMIVYNENLNLSRSISLDSNVILAQNRIYVDSTILPEFNKPASLTFKGLSFTDPQILKDGSICTTCSNISYNSGILTFEVDGFSDYVIQETPSEDEDEDKKDKKKKDSSSNNDDSGSTRTITGGNPSINSYDDPNSKSQTWYNVEEDEELLWIIEDFPITRMEIESSTDVEQGTISFENIDDTSKVNELNGTIDYIEIDVNDLDFEEMEIEFRVNKSLREDKIIMLSKYNSQTYSWEKIPIRFARNDEDYSYYRATIDENMEVFAIGFENMPMLKELAQEEEASSSFSESNQQDDINQTLNVTTSSFQDDSWDINWGWVIGMLVFVILIGIFYFIYRKVAENNTY